MTLRIPILLLVAALGWSCHRPANACERLPDVVNSSSDASAALADCLERLSAGARLALEPGVYTLKRPLVIDKPVFLTTAGMSEEDRGCSELSRGRCAVIRVDLAAGTAKPGAMPVQIVADSVTLSHLTIEGSGISPRAKAICRRPELRPLGGGIRVSGARFTLRKSVLRGFACYTALEIIAGAASPTVEGNVIGPNGDHRPGEIWADGVTIHDSVRASVVGNLFVDNTDVQLIFGGCRDCRVEGNHFRHGSAFRSASFAELMLHSWPSTSGDYRGTVVRGNAIDCGPERRCGYGIMIGSAPWYDGRMSGGSIVGNSIANAMIGLNVDALSGPVAIRGNRIVNSGGRFASDCGVRQWPAANVAPGSRHLLRGDPSNLQEGSVDTAGCLLNRRPR